MKQRRVSKRNVNLVLIGVILTFDCSPPADRFHDAQRAERWPVATPERVVVDPIMASDETTAAPRGELSMRGGAAAPAGYHAVLVAWTDGGYDSTWTTQAPYSPRITHRVELRPERTGVRVEYVPDDARDLVLVCMDSPRTRYAHFDYWSTYRPTANGGIRFESVHYRPSGAVQVIRAYPGPGESVTVQHTHPHRGGLRPWE